MKPEPGDLIEWVYKSDSRPVYKGEKLWSTPMNCYVSIDVHPVILVSITDEFYSWLTSDGLFHARADDTTVGMLGMLGMGRFGVVPRVVGEHR
jgi:hypothetical protein